MSSVESYFRNSSSKIEKIEGKYIFIQGKKFLDFSSNNFLGLKNDERIKEAAKKAIDTFGIDIDSNKTLSSHGEMYLDLRKKLILMKGQEDAILYNAGYNVSAGIIPNLVGENDVIFSDSQNFIDIYQGIYKSKAHLIRYKHNDIENLKVKLMKYRAKFKKALIITDSIFFTDGSQALLKEIIELKNLHDFILMVDDSNGDGIHGENGSGITSKPHLADDIDLVIGDFSRNYGGLGEYVCGKEKYINILLRNSLSKSMMYKVLISPLSSMISQKAIELAETETERRENILTLSKYLRDKLKKLGLNISNCDSHFIPVIFENNETAIKFSKFLYKHGFVASTTVGKTTIEPRVKFYINAMLEKEDIDNLISIINEFMEALEMSSGVIKAEEKEDIKENEEEKIEKEKIEKEKISEVEKQPAETVKTEEEEEKEKKEEEENISEKEIEDKQDQLEELVETEQEVVSMEDIFQTTETESKEILPVKDSSKESEEDKTDKSEAEIDVEDTEEYKKNKTEAFDNAEKMLDMLD